MEKNCTCISVHGYIMRHTDSNYSFKQNCPEERSDWPKNFVSETPGSEFRNKHGHLWCQYTGWWFGCHFLFSHILGCCPHPNWRTHIFQRGGYTTTNQICFNMVCSLLFPWPAQDLYISWNVDASCWIQRNMGGSPLAKPLVSPWEFHQISQEKTCFFRVAVSHKKGRVKGRVETRG